jgi:hypothetical protein
VQLALRSGGSDVVKVDVDVGLWGPYEIVGDQMFISSVGSHLTNLRACVSHAFRVAVTAPVQRVVTVAVGARR